MNSTKQASLSFILLFLLIPQAHAKKTNARPISFKVYANWCGPNWNNGKTPMNAIDVVCKKHDVCCHKKKNIGYGQLIAHCKCDRIVLREMKAGRKKALKAIKNKKKRIKAWIASVRFAAYYKIAPCWCSKKKCKKVCKKKRCKRVCKTKTYYGRNGRCLWRKKPPGMAIIKRAVHILKKTFDRKHGKK